MSAQEEQKLSILKRGATSGSSPIKSKVVKKSLEPKWDETLASAEGTLSAHLLAGPLQLRLMDQDMMTSQKMGYVDVDLAPLREADEIDFEAQPLQGAPKGTISFGVRWVPSKLTSVVA